MVTGYMSANQAANALIGSFWMIVIGGVLIGVWLWRWR